MVGQCLVFSGSQKYKIRQTQDKGGDISMKVFTEMVYWFNKIEIIAVNPHEQSCSTEKLLFKGN